ncbi:MAG: hypothetical protein RJB65_2277 [Actinomycetota bacterium]
MDCRARPPIRCDDGQVTDPRGTHPRRSAPLGVVLFTWAPPVLAWATGVAAVVARETTVAALALVAAIASSVYAPWARRRYEQRRDALLERTQIDALTGLPNRILLLHRIEQLLRGSWSRDEHPSLLFVDLDRFKNINDSFGHEAGDEVLAIVGRRLRDAVPSDATVARLSGDEFAVLLPAAASEASAAELAEALLIDIREPLALRRGDLFITASIGVATLSATKNSSALDLLRNADNAMYRAKDAGRDCVGHYDASMQERIAHRLALETALRRAIERDELQLYHQPILDITRGEVVGFEALMRWQRGEGDLVSPAEFIPIAEDNGTIVEIGAWALREALGQLRDWITHGVCAADATMSVNVSPRQLSDPAFPDVVMGALAGASLDPSALWLEVTESLMIGEPELALDSLRSLGERGVRIAMDDFGTGYSSLSLLQKFPLHRVKIDRAFVQGVATDGADRSLVRTIIAMASALDLDLVAEGVETMPQLETLGQLGCHKAQGYLISRPVPADAMRTTVSGLGRLGHLPGIGPD